MQATARPEANERWVTATRRTGQSWTADRQRRTAHGPGTTQSKSASSMTRVGRRSLRMARMSCCLLIWMQPHIQLLLSDCAGQIDHTRPIFNGVVCLSGTGRQGSGRHRSTTPRQRRLGLVGCPLQLQYSTVLHVHIELGAFPQCHNSPRLHGNAGVE